MSLARGHSTKRRFCLGLAGLSVSLLGCSSTESGPSGNAGAPSAGASSAGASSTGGSGSAAGSSSSAAGSAHGGQGGGSAGAANTAGSAATGHAGKGSTCELMECFVANTCLDQCGGNVVYTGCCACEPPSVNKLTCTGTK